MTHESFHKSFQLENAVRAFVFNVELLNLNAPV